MDHAEEISITLSGEMLQFIRSASPRATRRARESRIRSSLDDPRPDMTLQDVDARLAALFDRAEQAGGDAAA